MTDPAHSAPQESPRQEVRRLGWIVGHVAKLSPAGRTWLLSALADQAGMELVDRRSWRLRNDFRVLPNLRAVSNG